MKTCTRCGETKPLCQFPPVRRSEPEKLQSWCRACFAEANAKNYPPYYARDHDRIIARIAAQRDEIRRHVIQYLQMHPCVDCGCTDIVVLEFDHQGNKVADISTYAMGGRSWEVVKAEIDKCEVRCANCHRLRTAEGWGSRRLLEEAIALAPLAGLAPAARPMQLLLETSLPLRECRVCRAVKPLSDFPFRSLAKQTRQWICLACQRSYTRDWYGRNRRRQIASSHKNNVKRRREAAAMVREYLDQHHCVDCGETNPLVLEFDHLRDKDREISELVRMGAPWGRIKAEIDKCEVCCANCHRRRTATRGGWYRTVMV